MKKLSYILLIIFTMILMVSVHAKEVPYDKIPNNSYVIGNHLFTSKTSVTTRHMMLAAKTINGYTLDDMNVYYKSSNGIWQNGITGEKVSHLASYVINYEDKETTINSKEKNNYAQKEYTKDAIPNNSYVIGTHLFTSKTSVTIRHMMLAAKTIEGNSLNDMNVYYKTSQGIWKNVITDEIVKVPNTFKISFIDLNGIKKEDGYVTLEENEKEIPYGTESVIINIKSTHGGKISVTDDNKLSTSFISGNRVIISNLDKIDSGTIIIVKIKSAKTGEYTEGISTYKILVKKSSLGVPKVSIDENGLVTWDNIEGASSYEVSFDNINWKTKESGKVTIPLKNVGKITAYVRAKSSSNNYLSESEKGYNSVNVYSLKLIADSGFENVSGSGNYVSGKKIMLTSKAKKRYDFSNWEVVNGDIPNDINSSETTLTLTQNTTLKVVSTVVEKLKGYVNLEETEKKVTYGTSSVTFNIASSHGGTLSVSDDNDKVITSINGNEVTVSNLSDLEAGTKVKVIVKSEETEEYTENGAAYTIVVGKAMLEIPQVFINENGVVMWPEVKGATSYEVSFDNINWDKSESGRTIIPLENSGKVRVYVRAESNIDNYISIGRIADTEVNVYSLTLVKDEGIETVTESRNYVSGKEVTITGSAKEGYKFSKWSIKNGNTPSDVNNSDTTIKLTQNTTLKAISKKIEKIKGYISFNETERNVSYGTDNVTFNITSSHGGLLSVSDDNDKVITSIIGNKVIVSNLSDLEAGTEIKVTVKSAETDEYTEMSATYTIKISKATLGVPNVLIDRTGIVSWNNIDGASRYEVSFDNSNYVEAISGDIIIPFEKVGKVTAYVRAIPTSNYIVSESVYGSASINTNNLINRIKKLNKKILKVPEVSIDTDGKVIWDDVLGASRYEVSFDNFNYFEGKSGEVTIPFEKVGKVTAYVKTIPTSNYIVSENAYGSASTNIYSLTLSKDEGIESVSGTGNYASGKEVNLNATLNPGYKTYAWSSLEGKVLNKDVITINQNTDLKAISTPYTLKIQYSGNGGIWNNLSLNYTINTDGIVINNDTNQIYTQEILYGSNLSDEGLIDYNSDQFKWVRNGYQVLKNEEYFVENGAKKTVLNQNKIYSAYELAQYGGCDLKKQDCTIIVKVNWIPKTYTISFDANEGVGGQTTSVTAMYLQTLPAISASAPERKGYEFTGWFDCASAADNRCNQYYKSNGEPNIVSYNITNSIILYAGWKLKTIKITFDMNEGNTWTNNTCNSLYEFDNLTKTCTKNVTYSKKYGEMPTPIKTGYDFLGWYLQNSEKALESQSIVDIDENFKAVAHWKPSVYKVTLDQENATTFGTTIIYLKYATDWYSSFDTINKISKINKPSKTGYDFNGYYSQKNGNGIQIIDKDGKINDNKLLYTEDAIIYAYWTPQHYEVKYYPNGGTGIMDNSIATYSENFITKENEFQKTGYDFNGWVSSDSNEIWELSSLGVWENSNNNGNGTNYKKWNYSDGKNLYAQWKAKTYNVVLDKNGATAAGNEIAVATYDSSVLSKIVNPIRQYTITFDKNNQGASISTSTLTSTYKFNGWYTDASGGTKVASSANIPSLMSNVFGYTDENKRWIREKETTLYAQWTPQQLTLPEITKTGYTCAWYTSPVGGTKYLPSSTYTPTSSMKMYALCEPKEYSISFDTNGGNKWTDTTCKTPYKFNSLTGSCSKNITYDDQYGEMPIPTREGYEFLGWYTQSGDLINSNSSVKTINNFTVVAHWEPKKYKISFEENLFDFIQTNNDVMIDYDINNQYITLNGTTNSASFDLGKIYDKNIVLKDKYKITLKKISGSFVSTSTPKFVLGFQKDGKNFNQMIDGIHYKTLSLPENEEVTLIFEVNSKIKSANTLSFWYLNEDAYPTTFNNYKIQVLITRENENFVTYNKDYGTLPIPSKAGYEFLGWYTSLKGGNKITSTDKVTTLNNHKLYARWAQQNYTVTFDTNGGDTWTNTTCSKQTYISSSSGCGMLVVYKEKYNNLPVPTRKGYTFAGWYTSQSNGIKIESTSMVTSPKNHTLYAHWIAKTYNISLNSNGATKDGSQSASIMYDGITLSKITNPIRQYTVTFDTNNQGVTISNLKLVSVYTLNGWYTSAVGGNKVANSDTIPSLIANASGYTDTNKHWIKEGESTLYAQWTSQPIITPTISKIGYTCSWHTAKNGGNKVANSGARYTPIENVTLFAQCMANTYKIILNGNGATNIVNPSEIYLKYNDGWYSDLSATSSINKVFLPQKTGYKFMGYYTLKRGGSQVIDSTGKIVSDKKIFEKSITIYAQWQR